MAPLPTLRHGDAQPVYGGDVGQPHDCATPNYTCNIPNQHPVELAAAWSPPAHSPSVHAVRDAIAQHPPERLHSKSIPSPPPAVARHLVFPSLEHDALAQGVLFCRERSKHWQHAVI